MWRMHRKIERGRIALWYITLRNGANSKVTFFTSSSGRDCLGFLCFAINFGVLDSFFRCRHSFLSALCSSGTGGRSTVVRMMMHGEA